MGGSDSQFSREIKYEAEDRWPEIPGVIYCTAKGERGCWWLDLEGRIEASTNVFLLPHHCNTCLCNERIAANIAVNTKNKEKSIIAIQIYNEVLEANTAVNSKNNDCVVISINIYATKGCRRTFMGPRLLLPEYAMRILDSGRKLLESYNAI